MPNNLIRDMCGNSFNASLVCSALGKTSTLLDWINEDGEHQEGLHATAVASKQDAHAIYADLVSKVASRSAREYPNKQLPIQRTLPDLPDFGSETVDVELPQIGDRELAVNRKIKVTKEQRLAQHRSEAAAKILTQAEGVALENAELAWIFESLRAAVHATFDFHSMIRILWGFSNPQQAASILCDFPDVRRLRELQDAFHAAGISPSDKFKCIHVLLLLVELKERAQWPLGIVYVNSRDKSADVIYFGVPSANGSIGATSTADCCGCLDCGCLGLRNRYEHDGCGTNAQTLCSATGMATC